MVVLNILEFSWAHLAPLQCVVNLCKSGSFSLLSDDEKASYVHDKPTYSKYRTGLSGWLPVLVMLRQLRLSKSMAYTQLQNHQVNDE